MPDSANDLAGLIDQVKGLTGDLTRRFELLSARIDELRNTRTFRFTAALDGDWVGGTTNPTLLVPFGLQRTIARGTMAIALPNLCRIQLVRVSAQLSDRQLPAATVCDLKIGLHRISADTNNSEPLVEVSPPFAPGIPDQQAEAIRGRELIDNDRFRYLVTADFSVAGAGSGTVGRFEVPSGVVVLDSFQIDVIAR